MQTAPAWRRNVHLYLPLVTSALDVLFTLKTNPKFDVLENPGNILLVLAGSAIPTYLVGSFVYPTDRPNASPDDYVRFTRENDLYRVAVLSTYGRIYGTPFNLLFFIADVIFSFVVDAIVSELVDGKLLRSEFLVSLLWLAASHVVRIFIPLSIPYLGYFVGGIDRTLWRSAYIALVDDIVGILTRPNVQSFRGKAWLVLVQAFTIISVASVVFAKVRTPSQVASGASAAPENADADPQ